MRRVIGGKAYDTEKGEKLAEAESPCNRGDFAFWKERLYRTKGGVYFLHGEGGAMTSWSTACQGGRTRGENLRPLDEEKARAWAERYAPEEVEAIFGEAEEAATSRVPEGGVEMRIGLTNSEYECLQVLAKAAGRSRNEHILELLRANIVSQPHLFRVIAPR